MLTPLNWLPLVRFSAHGPCVCILKNTTVTRLPFVCAFSYVVDAKYKGNKLRCANHSQDPVASVRGWGIMCGCSHLYAQMGSEQWVYICVFVCMFIHVTLCASMHARL